MGITAGFSIGTPKTRRAWSNALQLPKVHHCQPRLLYWPKWSGTVEGERKTSMTQTILKNLWPSKNTKQNTGTNVPNWQEE